MKTITYWMVICFVLFSMQTVNAQHVQFLKAGNIEFERKINIYALYNHDNSWTEEYKSNIPQFKKAYFNLLFHENKMIYQPGRESTENGRLWSLPTEDNTIYSELDSGLSISQKKVFEEVFLVCDSTRKIEWKITDETRVIAGFECRRANAIIMDSIYVVAFYTNDIITSGGPESFTGLPGMILGVALPHEHITWFATKVIAENIKVNDLKAPVKGLKITNAGLKERLRQSLQNWGKNADQYIKAALL